jgi:segregation and condensation protein B
VKGNKGMEQEQVKQIIEALLFSCERPMSLGQIKEVLEEVDVSVIKDQIAKLRHEYKQTKRSFTIVEVAGGYQMSSEPQFAPWLRKFYRRLRAERLSRPSLETLAIIAYRQPITRLEIEDIRGVNVEGVLKTLLERSLVRISGRKDIAGRPFLYSTTKQFLEFFGLQSLDALPQLEEFGELVKWSEGYGELKEATQEHRSH